jgi:hypothetical protein
MLSGKRFHPGIRHGHRDAEPGADFLAFDRVNGERVVP